MVTIVQVTTDVQRRQTQELLAEYFDYLSREVDKVDASEMDSVPPLSGYRDEIANLPGRYAPPDGRLLLAQVDAQATGCVGLYKFDEGVCEIKRLWVRPAFRGHKIGRLLVTALIDEARSIGYHSILLSTVDVLESALALYRSFGFEIIPPYFDMPEEMLAHEIFMKLDLSPKSG